MSITLYPDGRVGLQEILTKLYVGDEVEVFLPPALSVEYAPFVHVSVVATVAVTADHVSSTLFMY